MIETENYSLKKMRLKYVNDNYISWFKNDKVKEYINFNPKNLEELKKDVKTKIEDKNSLFLAIFTKSKKHIGNILIHNIDKKNYSANLGILIGNKKFRNKKVGSETLKYLTNWLNKFLNIKKIYLGVSKNNKQAIRLYLKVGFEVYLKKKKTIIMCYSHLKNKFILGTAQFGLNYGITRKNNKTLEKNSIKNIYKHCNKIGVNHLDTASSYNFNFKLLPKLKWIIDTKIIINKDNTSVTTLSEIFKDFSQNRKLVLNTIYIHNPDELLTKNGISIMKMLESFKKKKRFNNIGISVYDLKNIKKILKNFKIDVIQLPYNIIDRRFEKIFSYLKSKKILIYARSLFLQGLLLSNNEIINHNSLKKFNKFAEGKDKLSLCLNFVKKNRYIDKYIIGIQNSSNLAQILNTKIIKNINFPKKLSSSDKKLIDPRLWVY